MLQTLAIVFTAGLADSMNPSTVGPALYLAADENGLRRLLEFTLGAFAVYFLAGVVLTLGPGRLLIGLMPHPTRHTRYLLETGVGIALLAGAGIIWSRRGRLAERGLGSGVARKRRSAAVLGASIMAVELPTAFPYFAAIAAVVGSGLRTFDQLVLLAVFNLCFVLPLLVIAATLLAGGHRSAALLSRGRRLLERHWPKVLAGLLGMIGAFATVMGATGLLGAGHGPVARAMRHLHTELKP